MSCYECGGTGFVLQRGDFTTRRKTYQKAEYVRRCSRYVEYFEQLGTDLSLAPIGGDQVCDAASLRHREVQNKGERKDGKRGRRL